MSEVSLAYQLAQHIHDSFYPHDNSVLTPQEIAASGVHHDPRWDTAASEMLVAHGEAEGGRMYQSLSHGPTRGDYHFTTRVGGIDGKIKRYRITEKASLESAEALVDSFFMDALFRIALSRTD